MEKIVKCKECEKPIVLGVQQVERFWPKPETKLVWSFHRKPCYERFIEKLEAKRNKIFQEELAKLQTSRGLSLYSRSDAA